MPTFACNPSFSRRPRNSEKTGESKANRALFSGLGSSAIKNRVQFDGMTTEGEEISRSLEMGAEVFSQMLTVYQLLQRCVEWILPKRVSEASWSHNRTSTHGETRRMVYMCDSNNTWYVHRSKSTSSTVDYCSFQTSDHPRKEKTAHDRNGHRTWVTPGEIRHTTLFGMGFTACCRQYCKRAS